METVPTIPPLPSNPPPPSPAVALAKEGPIPHPSKHLWVLVGLGILSAGILVGFLGANVFNLSKDTSSLAPTPSPKDAFNFSQLAGSPTSTIDPSIYWKTYTNTQYGFSFRHPNFDDTCCMMSGPITGNPTHVVTLADKSTTRANTDKPFDGLSVYSIALLSNQSLHQYIESEKSALIKDFTAMVDPGIVHQGATENITVAGQPAIKLVNYSWDQNSRIYFKHPYRNMIIEITKGEESLDHFSAYNQILSTFRFLDAVSPTPTNALKSTPVQSNGVELKGIRYTLPANWGATLNPDNLHLAPKSGGGYLYIEVFNYPGTTGRRDYYCQLHKYCIAETEFTEMTIGNISGYKATRLDNSGGGSEYFGAKGNKFYIISTYSPPAPNDFDAAFESVLSSLIF